MNNYEFEKYVCTKETLKNTIFLYGVAIIPNILNENTNLEYALNNW
jgi:hypothetical protein